MTQTLDFNQIQILLQSEPPFSIDFESAWRWSGYPSRRGAKSKLKENFVEGTHYISFKQSNSQLEGGRIKTFFWLTTECLKSFALMSGTQKGREVNLRLIESETILKASICQEWSERLTKVSLAICLLSTPWMKLRRDRYLTILSTEHAQLLALFRQFAAVPSEKLQPSRDLRATLKRLAG